MPCGGIFPVDDNSGSYSADDTARCWQCRKGGEGPWSFVEEWDAFIHDRCIDEFLKTPEGEIVADHGHEIERR